MTNEDTLIKELFKNAVHIGHRTQKWNPRMKKYLYGERDGVHIINLEKTVKKLDEALKFFNKLNSEGKTVLFVSTKPQSQKLIENAAITANMPYVVTRWIPGLLTNFSTMKNRIKYLKDLKEKEASGELDKYTKKEISKFKKEMEKLQFALGGVEDMKSKPDAVFIIDIERDKIALKEAKTINIPVIAIVDSNVDPSEVDYPIPGNDDALKSLTFLLGKIGDILNKAPKSKK